MNTMKRSIGLLSLLALLISPGVLFGHHGNTAYDETVRVSIKGTVTEFVWTNPHSQIYLDVKDSSGKIVKWGVETNSPGILSRAGWTRHSLKAGDEVTIILCPAKNGQPVAYALPQRGRSVRADFVRAVAGQCSSAASAKARFVGRLGHAGGSGDFPG